MAYAIGVQRQSTADSVLLGAPIDFNQPITLANEDPSITYAAGVFSFTNPGIYLVEWFVVVQSALTTSGPKFSLVATTGALTPVVYPSTSSFKTGTLSGSAIVEIIQSGVDVTNIQLRNDTGADVSLGINTDILANITITKVLPQIDGLEVNLTGGTTIAQGARVAYNTQESLFTSNQVSNAAGVFTTNSAGVYVFDWTISIAGADGVPGIPATGIQFDLRDSVTTATVVGTSVAPAVTQQYITGTAIVSAAAGQTFELVNNTLNGVTGVTLIYDTTSIQASMRVFTIS